MVGERHHGSRLAGSPRKAANIQSPSSDFGFLQLLKQLLVGVQALACSGVLRDGGNKLMLELQRMRVTEISAGKKRCC
jgi:hypothetical protein